MKSISFFTLFFLFFLFVQCGSDQSTVENIQLPPLKKENPSDQISLQAGDYGDLQLAFNGKQVTGFYNMVTGNGQFGCSFYFVGKTEGKKGEVPIQWYFPGDDEHNSGTLTILADKIQLKLKGNPGGQCMPELLAEGENLSLLSVKNWKSIRVIKSKKTPIYEEAEDGFETGMFFKKGDVLCILEEKGDWLRAELVGKEKMGWVKLSDFDM